MTDYPAQPHGVGWLFGRNAEVESIKTLLDTAATQGGSLLLTGDAGVGKSVLLDMAAKMASASGTRVVRVDGVQFQAGVSFLGLDQLLTPLSAELEHVSSTYQGALLTALGLGDGPCADRLVVSNATLAVLLEATSAGPLLVVADDVQWLDRPSADALAFVARRLAGTRIGLIAASRPGSSGAFRSAGLPEHEIRPLDEDAAAGLVGTRFPTLAARVQQRVLAEAQGNPLALLELPAALSGAQRTAQEALPEVLPLSRRLEDLFASRVGDLPAPTRELLLVMALEGTGHLGVLQTTGGLAPLGPAEKARLVSVDTITRRVEFRHPLVRSTVVGLSTAIDCRRAHRALARVFIATPERRAWHLAEATREPDEQVALLLEQAARRTLARGDAAGAVTALKRAAELSPGRADRGRRLLEAVYLGAEVNGDLSSASRLLDGVREAEPELIGSLPAAVAASCLLLDAECDIDTAHRLLVTAIEAHLDEYDAGDGVLQDALHTLIMLCWWGARAELWAPFEAAVERLAPPVPDLLELCARSFGDPVRAAAPTLDRLAAVVGELGDETDPVRITRVGIACVYTDRLGDCREALRRVVRDGRRTGAVALSINALVSSCVDSWLTGQWDQARRLAAEGVELCTTYGYRRYSFVLAGYIESLVGAARGASDLSLAAADELARWAVPRRAGIALTFAHHLRALVALGREDYEEAYHQASAISPAGVLAPYTPHALWVLLDLVEAAVRTGRRAEASAHVAAMRAADLAAISPRLALLSAGSAAVAAPDAEASELFEKALAVPGAERWPFDLARLRLAYGELLHRTGASPPARTQLGLALDTFQQLGARPWAVRATNELRAMGRTGRRARAVTPESITPQELEIAMMAASGLTNKQIGERLYLSPRTIGAHLYQVFPKLGVTSRAALRDALATLPPKESSPDAADR